MSAPENPRDPVISTAAGLRDALIRRFLDNAWHGHDAANDDLVALITERRRERGDA